MIKNLLLKKRELMKKGIINYNTIEDSTNLFYKAFETAPSSMVLVQYVKNKPLIKKVNKTFTEYYGYKEKEVVNKTPSTLKSNKCSRDVYNNLWRCVLDPKIGFWKGEIINKRKDGSFIDVILSISTIFNNNKPVYFIANHEDITARKESERLLKLKNEELENSRTATVNMMEDLSHSNAELKKMDQVKTDFLNIVSHELKTPLTAISAYLEILDDDHKGLTKQQMHCLRAISRNGKQLKTIITNILELSRIESGRFELINTVIDVKEKISNVVDNLKVLSNKKGIKLLADVKKNFKIETDELRFEEMLNNLISNSIKFTDTGSVTVKATKEKSNAFISVIDTGAGIPEEKIDHLFEKFFQVDSSISRKVGGTGLGLSITKRIIELQGGKIWVTSEIGKGSVFNFTLPLKPKAKRGKKK